uniref:Uncharacterized protein n=1 Tax=Noctiluca scintillans TaxID=2966 RepID=A0A7S1AV00_NOCSC|mmetsp:Transcript_60359/g.160550  ORF Transcript_60359/g.160550 Transcript_60359/m.160550 type:complete len:220 (+) Transcript_60359:93-752(+)|eukprot:CAMPEP_0194502772 /NCGR_PEP_ID=MMETSP0253-20130528/27045_1 /TAXON_ID=2966 /ORGANISM="Noctiluca scintillans" /LENGTH=219 /DNA_ID=CAMNT_0039344985 /DNA_START=80 /DNA_END=739 /DNA_ORIENTATION=+
MSEVLVTTAPHFVSEEEEIIDLPEAEKETDVLRRATIRRVLDGVVFYGTVQDIEQGKDSGERLYLVKYTDGDFEHLTADEVRDSFCDSEEFVLASQPRATSVSPARDGTVATIEEEVPIVDETVTQETHVAEVLRTDMAKKPATHIKATLKATKLAQDLNRSMIMKKPASVTREIAKRPASVTKEIAKKPASAAKATPKAIDNAQGRNSSKMMKKPTRA